MVVSTVSCFTFQQLDCAYICHPFISAHIHRSKVQRKVFDDIKSKCYRLLIFPACSFTSSLLELYLKSLSSKKKEREKALAMTFSNVALPPLRKVFHQICSFTLSVFYLDIWQCINKNPLEIFFIILNLFKTLWHFLFKGLVLAKAIFGIFFWGHIFWHTGNAMAGLYTKHSEGICKVHSITQNEIRCRLKRLLNSLYKY